MHRGEVVENELFFNTVDKLDFRVQLEVDVVSVKKLLVSKKRHLSCGKGLGQKRPVIWKEVLF